MSRKKIVAGNWKMNLLTNEAIELVNEINSFSKDLENVELIVFPPALFISEISKRKEHLKVGVQNLHAKENGAYTGEISITQIKDAGATHCLIGHSERRMLFGENDEIVKEKVNSAIEHNVTVIFCCGEPLEVREAGNEMTFVKQQLINSLFQLSSDKLSNCVIAYEPIWAIGTGKTASVDQVEEMHAAIRSWVNEKYGPEIAGDISILYGGSCNESNAKGLFARPNVDGGLIGGASLKADSFITIARSF